MRNERSFCPRPNASQLVPKLCHLRPCSERRQLKYATAAPADSHCHGRQEPREVQSLMEKGTKCNMTGDAALTLPVRVVRALV